MFQGLVGRLFQWIADRRGLRLTPEQYAEMTAAKKRRKDALTDTTLSPLDRLIFWWGEPPAPGASNQELAALEAHYSIRLPNDFRAYLERVMPQGNEWDVEGTRWWPLSDLKSVREECAHWDTQSSLDSDKLIVFADFLIWCYAWAIDCSDGSDRGKVAIITGDDHYVAASFEEFLDRYLRDDPVLHV